MQAILLGPGTSLTLQGRCPVTTANPAGRCLLEAGGNGNHIIVSPFGSLVLDGLVLRGGACGASTNTGCSSAAFGGGAVWGGGGSYIRVQNSLIANNSAGANGGAVFSLGLVDVVNSTFAGNRCGGSGGAIYATEAFNASHSLFDSNTAALGVGGALMVTPGAAGIVSVALTNNQVLYGGAGGAAFFGGALHAFNISVVGNAGLGNGGGFFATGPVSLTGSAFLRNTASGSGAALVCNSTSDAVNVSDTVFGSNVAYFSGGALLLQTSSATFVRCNFSSNQAWGPFAFAGALEVQNALGGSLNLVNTSFAGNRVRNERRLVSAFQTEVADLFAFGKVRSCEMLN